MNKIGNDGLTDAERAESARRWSEGAGKLPTAAEMLRTRKIMLYFRESNDMADAIRKAGGDPDAAAPVCSCGRHLCRKARRGEKGHVMPY